MSKNTHCPCPVEVWYGWLAMSNDDGAGGVAPAKLTTEACCTRFRR